MSIYAQAMSIMESLIRAKVQSMPRDGYKADLIHDDTELKTFRRIGVLGYNDIGMNTHIS